MTGFETVLLRVAGTAASALVKSLLSRTPGAGLTPDPARPSPAGASHRRNWASRRSAAWPGPSRPA